jgi:hypothetical protein
MLVLGEVLRVRRWADALLESEPDSADFAREAKRLAMAVELTGLKRLAEA